MCWDRWKTGFSSTGTHLWTGICFCRSSQTVRLMGLILIERARGDECVRGGATRVFTALKSISH